MANITITVPTAAVNRAKIAYKSKLQSDDAVDPDNPTGTEILKVVKRHLITELKLVIQHYERDEAHNSFEPDPIDITE